MRGSNIVVEYRFEDDPEDVVREYISNPIYDHVMDAWCLIPANAFPGKKIIPLNTIAEYSRCYIPLTKDGCKDESVTKLSQNKTVIGLSQDESE